MQHELEMAHANYAEAVSLGMEQVNVLGTQASELESLRQNALGWESKLGEANDAIRNKELEMLAQMDKLQLRVDSESSELESLRERDWEIEKLHIRVEKQNMLLEDRLEAEAEMRRQKKMQQQEIKHIWDACSLQMAFAASLQLEKNELVQSITHIKNDLDAAHSNHAALAAAVAASAADSKNELVKAHTNHAAAVAAMLGHTKSLQEENKQLQAAAAAVTQEKNQLAQNITHIMHELDKAHSNCAGSLRPHTLLA
jgi:chromosome segregation ATPase